jgi:glycerol-3-phosphate dehydrogenase
MRALVVDTSAAGISLIKGVKFIDGEDSAAVPLQLLSATIQSQLNLSSIAVLMGANVAADVAQDKVFLI